MCGIIGFLSTQSNAFNTIIESLKLLQNRGYDSAGICCIKKDKFIIKKSVELDLNIFYNYKDEYKNCKVGIGHTRWCTNGNKSIKNAHPHLDVKNRIALVHNGIIDNYDVLKKALEKEGYIFKSDTDSEVIVNLLSYNYLKLKDPVESIKETNKTLEGSWALSILFLDQPNKIYYTKNGSPLLVGYSDRYSIASSEPLGFYNLVEQYIILEDNDVIYSELKDEKYINVVRNRKYTHHKVIKNKCDLTPYPYPHWTIKEIMEQPISIQKALNMGHRIKNSSEVKLGGIENYKEELMKIDNLLIIAMGTSHNAALLGEKYFKMLKSVKNVRTYDASEFCEYDIPSEGKTAALFLSQSGETRDVYLALQLARKHGIFLMSIINVVNSLIAREAMCGIYLNAGTENGVASTKSFTSQVVVLSLMAIWFAQHKNISLSLRKDFIQSLKELPLDVENTLKCFTNIKKIVTTISKNKSFFLLGSDLCYSIARESSLKIKELAYIHAEAYPGGSLKHGPFALIESGTPIFIFAHNDSSYNKMSAACEEVKARGALTIIITNKQNIDKNMYDFCIPIAYNKIFYPLLSSIPFQVMAYELALFKSKNDKNILINPDRPKNLAKVVTTI